MALTDKESVMAKQIKMEELQTCRHQGKKGDKAV